MEVMVTADSTMKDYYGEGLSDYIMTLMSIVSMASLSFIIRQFKDLCDSCLCCPVGDPYFSRSFFGQFHHADRGQNRRGGARGK